MLLLPRLRLCFVLTVGAVAALWPILDHKVAHASADDDDDSGGGDDDDDGAKGGGDDDDGGGGDTEEPDEEDPDQPPITAGGLFTIKTYPTGAIARPLTMTKGITELKLGVGFDISNANAFKTFGAEAGIRYGMQDNVELKANFHGENNFKQFAFEADFEGSLSYDLVDFRAGIELTKATTGTTFGIPIGFPFRYAPKPQVALIALQKFFEIQFTDAPDFVPDVGIIAQPIPQVAILIDVQARIKNFDFSTASSVEIPASIQVQASPNNKLDAGFLFRFDNLKPPKDMTTMMAPKFYDQRFILFFGQLRI